MFDSIAIHPISPFRSRVDLGELAEALLFYDRVHLLLSEATLTELIQLAGIDTVLAILESGLVNIVLFYNGAATHSTGPPTNRVHNFIVWERGRRGLKQRRTHLELIHEAIERATHRKKKSRSVAYRFLDSAAITSVNAEVPAEEGISELAMRDVEDIDYVRSSVGSILHALIGEPPPPLWRFDINRTDHGLLVESNLDYPALTHKMRALYKTDAELSPGLILDFFNQARLDLFQAARLNSELLTSQLSSALIKNRLVTSINLVGTSRVDELAAFQDMVLHGQRIGEAVRSGHKSLDQVLRLVEKAQSFRSWLREQPPDATLLREYYSAVTRESWVERLPNKHLRFAIFAGIGAGIDIAIPTGLSTALGAAVGAIDTYVVDRLARGWKPNHFVDRELRSFVKSR